MNGREKAALSRGIAIGVFIMSFCGSLVILSTSHRAWGMTVFTLVWSAGSFVWVSCKVVRDMK